MTGEEAVRACHGLIWRYARQLARRHHLLDAEDLYQVGAMGAVQAAGTFDPAVGVRFATYAGPRVVGAMYDHVRDTSWASRADVAAAKAAGRELATMTSFSVLQARKTGAAMGMGLFKGRPSQSRLMPEEHDPVYHHPPPDESEAELMAALRRLGVGVSERERAAVVLYFCHQMVQSEVAAALGVNDSRASQLINGVLVRAGKPSGRRVISHGHKRRKIKNNTNTRAGLTNAVTE